MMQPWPVISWRQLHTWGGLVLGWLLMPVFVTGTLAVFAPELSRWMQPELPLRAVSAAEALDRAVAFLQQEAPIARNWRIAWPHEREQELAVYWDQGQGQQTALLDPLTGAPLQVRETLGGHLFVDFHYQLLAGKTGLWLVAVAGLALLLALITGILIHARIFKDFFTFRPAAGGHKAWLDGHNLSGVITLPFLLMIAYSGVSLSFGNLYPAALERLFNGNEGALRGAVVRNLARPASGEAAPLHLPLSSYLLIAEQQFGTGNSTMVRVSHPGDRHANVEVMRSADRQLALVAHRLSFDGVTGQLLSGQDDFRPLTIAFRAMAGLHVGHYGGMTPAWLYFICGTAGTVLIASGLILYPLKRRQRHGPSRWLTTVDRLNQISIGGSLLACLLLFWANRLLAVELSHRSQWEVACFVGGWLVSALLSANGNGWRRQWQVCGWLALLLPAVEWYALGDGWWQRITALDPVYLAMDIGAITCGVGLLVIARHQGRKPA